MKTWLFPVVLIVLLMVGGFVVWAMQNNSLNHTTTAEQAGPITAASVGEVPANETFTLAESPDASFSIGNIYFGTGGIVDSYCSGMYQSNTTYIYLQDQPVGSSPVGTCIDASQQIDGQDMRVVAFTLTINNNGATDLYGTFVRGTYQLPNGTKGAFLNRIAQTNPPWAGYGATAYSSRSIVIGLEMPLGVNKLNLYYGDYPVAGGETTQANFNDEGGYVVDFSNDTIAQNPG